MKTRPVSLATLRRGRALLVASFDTAASLVLAGLLAPLPLVALLIATTEEPWHRCFRWELRLAWEERVAAESLPSAVRQKLEPSIEVAVVDLENRADTTWLRLCTATPGFDPVGVRLLKRVDVPHDLWTGVVEWEVWRWWRVSQAQLLALVPEGVRTRLPGGECPLPDTKGSPLALMSLVLPASSLGLLVAALALRRWRRTPDWGGSRLGVSRSLVAGAGLGVAASAGSALLERLQRALGVPAAEQPWVSDLATSGAGGLALLVVVGVVLAPLSEELFFRGHLFRYLACEASPALAYGYSAGVFAALHLNPSGVFAYLWYGALFAWSYHRWRTLTVPIVAHATSNAVAILILAAGA